MSEQIKSPLNWDCSYALPLPSGISCGGGGDVTIEQVESTSAQAAAAAVAGHDSSATAHLSIQRRTLTGNLVLTTADLPQQKIIPDAARDVMLPAEGATQWRFEICHGGSANTVTVKRAGGTVVASLIAGSPVVVAWDGVAFGFC